MKYDFTSIIDRQGQDAMAVDGLECIRECHRQNQREVLILFGYELSDSADDSGGHY